MEISGQFSFFAIFASVFSVFFLSFFSYQRLVKFYGNGIGQSLCQNPYRSTQSVQKTKMRRQKAKSVVIVLQRASVIGICENCFVYFSFG